MKMKGLGRGLDALLAGDESKKEIQRSLPVTALQPGKYQPRTQMDKGIAGGTGGVDSRSRA